MKKYFFLPLAVVLGALTFTACSDDDDDDNNTGNNSESTIVNDARFKDKSYGQAAVDACAKVVSELENANTIIASAKLNSEQEQFLRQTLADLVSNVIVPTYTELADDVEDLEKTLSGLTVSIDSWPLNRSLLLSYFRGGMNDEMLDDATILGFHALEFILFRNGQPRRVAELQTNDTYRNFTSVSGAEELRYAQTICKLLKERCFQLQVAWEGEKNASRVAVVKAAGLEYTTENGLSYGDNLTQAGTNAKSTFPSIMEAVTQVLSDDEGSCAAIATEVGTAKIANPFSAGDISYVESPYSYNSITDFQDNIRSIRNVWYGSTNGTAASNSFSGFFTSVGQSATNTSVVNAFQNAITRIGQMPAPFVKYCSTIWNIAFEDDEDWE